MKELLRDDGFQLALAWSAGLTALAFVLNRFARLQVGFAAVATVATLLVVRDEYQLSTRLVVGIALLAFGGALCATIAPRLTSRPGLLAVRLVAMVPGAVFVALALEGVPRWVTGVALVAIVAGAPLVAMTDHRAPRVVPPLTLVTALGVYVCVPDTEFARILAGAFLAAALLAFDAELRAVAAGSGAAIGVIVWDACQEGAARPGAVVGAVACLGALVLVPVFGRRLRLEHPWTLVAWGVAAVHVALVLWCSRVAGLRQSAWVALAVVIVGFAVASAAIHLLQRVRTRPRSA